MIGTPTTATWSGISGTSYTFEVHDLSTTFRPVSGVYIIGRAVWLGHMTRLEALYVGEAQSLEDRLNTRRDAHEGFKRALAHGATHVCALLAPNGATERLRIETDLRHGLNPICNLQGIDVAHR